jgi:hypothetical protein
MNWHRQRSLSQMRDTLTLDKMSPMGAFEKYRGRELRNEYHNELPDI